jgi:hypothetical protein
MNDRLSRLAFGLASFALVACGDDPSGSLSGGQTQPTTVSSSQSGTDPAPSGNISTGGGSSGSSGSSGSQSGTDAGAPATDSGSPAPDAGTPPGTTGGGTAVQTCIDAINSYRKTVGSPALTEWKSAEPCTDGEAKTDSIANKAHSAFGTCGEWAQDECPGWPGPSGSMIGSCLQMMWAEGPGGGHYENMKNPSYTQVSCGFYTLPDGSVWATQNFR